MTYSGSVGNAGHLDSERLMGRVLNTDGASGVRFNQSNRFSIFDLFVWVTCFAVAALFASMGMWLISSLWIGLMAGVKLGPSSSYPTFLIVVFGGVAGGLFAAAIAATLAVVFLYSSSGIDLIESKSTTIAANTRGLLIAGAAVLWVPPILMVVWLALLPFRKDSGTADQKERLRTQPSTSD